MNNGQFKNLYFDKKIIQESEYRFGVVEARTGLRYVVLEQIRYPKDPGASRQRLVIPAYALSEFNQLYHSASHFLHANEVKSFRVEDVRKVYPNAFKKWRDEEDDQLRQLYVTEGKGVKEISGLMHRGGGGIASRLQHLGIIEDYKLARP